MIAKIAKKTATYFARKNIFKHEDIPTYSYGFELLFSTFINGLGLLIISILMNIVLGAALFVLAFIPIRLAAGGYHAKHHWSCCLAINITFLSFALLLRYMSDSLLLPYIFFAIIVSSVIIWRFSPVEAVNKPASEAKRKRLRERSILIASINMIVALICYLIPALPIICAAHYLSGALAASLSMVAAVITIKYGSTDSSSS